VFETVSGSGTEGGMITHDRLTGDRQFMNMDEFHRFGQSDLYQEKFADYCIERDISLMRYTLCVFQGWQRWNSFWNDFTPFHVSEFDSPHSNAFK
jgi:hypothetical protein